MKFLAPNHVSAIYLTRGPISVKLPAQGRAHVTVADPTPGDRASLAAAGFVAVLPRTEKVPAK